MHGIHVVQHFPMRTSIDDIGELVCNIIGGLQNPLLAIINIKRNPGLKYQHVVKNTKHQGPSVKIFINNSLKKYPQVERIVMEGGEDIVLYSSEPFNNE